MLPNDKHAQNLSFFWPNGADNLTDVGIMRQFRLGVALRKRYSSLLYYPDHLLVLSSEVYRCQESAKSILQGLFSIDQNRATGIRLLDHYNANCSRHELASSSSSPTKWQQVPIDLSSVPTLSYVYLKKCRWRQSDQGKSPIDSNLLLSPAVANLSGIMQLKQELEENYNLKLDYTSVHHWATILIELRLARDAATINYTDHFAHWINKPIELDNEIRTKLENLNRNLYPRKSLEQRLPKLFDIYEALALYSYRDRIAEGTTSRIQLGPMLTSLVDSQQASLMDDKQRSKIFVSNNDKPTNSTTSHFVDPKLVEMYNGKRMILYSTHDSILQLLMFRMLMISEDPPGSSYIERFVGEYDHSMRSQFLAGLRMSEFGTSLLFELYEMQQFANQSHQERFPIKSYAFVRAVLYLEEDPVLGPIEFESLELGSICKRLFRMKFPSISESEMEQLFYDQDFVHRKGFHPKFSCPFALFRNVTMQDYAINREELDGFCLPTD